MNAVCVRIEGSSVARALRDVAQKLDASTPEVVLDLSAVNRMEPAGIKAMEELAAAAGEKGVKVELRGVAIDVYRVLKLMKLTERFTFTE